MSEIWGHDIKLLRDLTRQSSRTRAHDLALRRGADNGGLTDLDLWGKEDNLLQALLLRFLTPVGELAELGHPNYGSRLFELIGRLNNTATRNLAKLYTLQALAAEPRVEEVLSISVKQDKDTRTKIVIALKLKIIDSKTPLNLVFPYDLAGDIGT